MSASLLSLARETEPAPEIVSAIADGLGNHMDALFPGSDWTPRYLVARDESGAVQAGMRYVVALEWLFVNWLWVAEAYRGAGEGSRLMAEVEQEARSLGCRGVYLDTFSFQAPEFYEKLGYREFGRIGDFPKGFDRIWFMKRF